MTIVYDMAQQSPDLVSDGCSNTIDSSHSRWLEVQLGIGASGGYSRQVLQEMLAKYKGERDCRDAVRSKCTDGPFEVDSVEDYLRWHRSMLDRVDRVCVRVSGRGEILSGPSPPILCFKVDWTLSRGNPFSELLTALQ